jgi:hypothetical protein
MNRSNLSLGQITVKDGTSNTLMFGEGIGGTGVGDRNYVFTWAGCGAMPTAWGLGRGNRVPLEGGSEWYRFSSRHVAVVQFCFGDGSVRGLRYGTTTRFFSPDWYVLAQLSGVNDGWNYNTEALLD